VFHRHSRRNRADARRSKGEATRVTAKRVSSAAASMHAASDCEPAHRSRQVDECAWLWDETFIGLKPDWEVTSPRPGLRVFLLGARTTTF